MEGLTQAPSREAAGPTQMPNGHGQGMGSVRRAREKVEAGLLSNQSQDLRNRTPSPSSDAMLEPSGGKVSEKLPPTSQPRQAVIAPPRVRQPPPSVSSQPIRANPGAIGSAIGKPAPMLQWPPSQPTSGPRRTTNSPTKEAFSEAGSLPRRPPRPAAPQLLGSSTAELAEFFRSTGPQARSNPKGSSNTRKYGDVSPESPAGVHELPASTPSGSRPSTASSIGSIPDFPIPVPTTPRRVGNLGPPPTRRGGSNLYSQSSYVSPIPEESPQRSHGSFASSHVIPSSWGSGPPDPSSSGGLDGLSDEDDLHEEDDGRESRGADHDEESGLVRKASLGKRHKPSLTTIRSAERLEEDAKVPTLNQSRSGDLRDFSVKSGKSSEEVAPASRTPVTASSSIPGTGPVTPWQPDSPASTVSSRVNPFKTPADSGGGSSPESQDGLTSSHPSPLSGQQQDPPVAPTTDPRIHKILGSLEKGGAIAPQDSKAFSSEGKGDRKAGMRRPARLNLDAVREADKRGSLTSLRDLITRATKLASNLDRGRTASRLDLQLSGDEKDMYRERNSDSISDILHSFPPPAVATPTGDRSSRWPSPFPSSPLARGHNMNSSRPPSETGKRRRRCCGMPFWSFVLLCVIAILLIAAAIVIPITLVVLPRRHNNQDSASDQGLAQCQTDLICANGGTNVLISNICHCNCPSGFIGTQCHATSDDGCVVTNAAPGGGDVQNATVGSSIPRLFDAAQTTFGIPLNASILYPLFNTSKLSCSSENALVNFNGRSQRRSLRVISSSSLTSPAPTARAELRQKRQTSVAQAITSNDIILAGTATASSYVPTATSANPNIDGTAIDFGRIAVLFVLQQTKQINIAVQVQDALQDFFGGGGGETVSVAGTPIMIDFGKGMVSLGNGTAVGGKWKGQ
ncbi:MAG: hypothetical protein M1812_005539 [Candelaria pacifica]|nr:MAG: hypothetical protein M1812_005539 [Candelaria pacifica]